MNSELKIRVSHDLQTHLNRMSDFEGSLRRISVTTSGGM